MILTLDTEKTQIFSLKENKKPKQPKIFQSAKNPSQNPMLPDRNILSIAHTSMAETARIQPFFFFKIVCKPLKKYLESFLFYYRGSHVINLVHSACNRAAVRPLKSVQIRTANL